MLSPDGGFFANKSMSFTPSTPFSRRPGGGKFDRKFNKDDKDEHRVNERIRVPQVRLIDQNGGQVGVVDTRRALQMARDAGLDLMEVAPNARPPVCKILDYGKYKYEQKKKEAQARKNQVIIKVKEVQFRPGTDTHDREVKYRNVRSFLEEGDKAKITVMFRGREVAHAENGMEIMKELIERMKDIGEPESPPKMEGKKMIMVIAPIQGKAAKKPGPAPIKLNGSSEK